MMSPGKEAPGVCGRRCSVISGRWELTAQNLRPAAHGVQQGTEHRAQGTACTAYTAYRPRQTAVDRRREASETEWVGGEFGQMGKEELEVR